MRRHPNMHASIENAPGPSNASAAPSVANSKWTSTFPGFE